jgi:hypothetical protein
MSKAHFMPSIVPEAPCARAYDSSTRGDEMTTTVTRLAKMESEAESG